MEGLTFTSGAQTGTTDASGTFKFEEGGSVQFKLGNVVLGQAPGKALMTPLDLVQAIDSAATTTDPRVVQIVQFLMTVDASPTAAAMLMPALAAANAANVTAVNLSAGLVDLAPIVSAITTHTLVTPAAAAAHLLALATVTTPTQGVFAALDSPTNPKLE